MALTIHIEGIVQGVGFRPFVFRLAQELRLSGWVYNATDGVHIFVQGDVGDIKEFLRRLETDKPPAASISHITKREAASGDMTDFAILMSDAGKGERTLVSPDLATCPDCLFELLDCINRRYHYPFINCTNCGPRFTIINRLPYDRAHTTMSAFTLCDLCGHEYNEPLDRRFHAQPNACFTCGPRLELYVPENEDHVVGASIEQSDELIRRCADLIAQGNILAVKGLGGYHLVCDAGNEQTVTKLRERKHRPRKPLAVMAAGLESAKQHFYINEAEAALLTSPAAPIVLLKAKESQQVLHEGTNLLSEDRIPLASCVTCGLAEVGVMLPSTPVQHLLVRACGRLLVMTSGNISEEPIIGDDALAQQLLDKVADAFLLNDRPIVSRYDDSVLRVLCEGESGAKTSQPQTQQCQIQHEDSRQAGAYGVRLQPTQQRQILHEYSRVDDEVHAATCTPQSRNMTQQLVRRARGYAPTPLALPMPVPQDQTILAVGAEQKSTFCIANAADAFISQHLGDLAHARSFDTYLETIRLYEQLFVLEPTIITSDLHPGYLSTKWAYEQAMSRDLFLFEVQHHHAHIAAVMAENIASQRYGIKQGDTGLTGLYENEVIGIALDGTGYGSDGTLWGGEVLVASLCDFYRYAHLECFHLPGGTQAIQHPLRIAYALLLHHGLTEHPAAQGVKDRLGETNLKLIEHMIQRGVNSPLTSSAGRLFDAVSALLGVCDEASYEGEPAILLEAAMSYREGKPGDFTSRAQQGIQGSHRSEDKERWAGNNYSNAHNTNNAGNVHYTDNANNAGNANNANNSQVIFIHDIIVAVLDKMSAGASTAEISRYFHEAIMCAFVDAVLLARTHTGLETVALSGGVFNNCYIATHMPKLLRAAGFKVLTHELLPPNDGCISYGQASVACAWLHKLSEADTLAPCV